jgi:hypothetical protein
MGLSSHILLLVVFSSLVFAINSNAKGIPRFVHKLSINDRLDVGKGNDLAVYANRVCRMGIRNGLDPSNRIENPDEEISNGLHDQVASTLTDISQGISLSQERVGCLHTSKQNSQRIYNDNRRASSSMPEAGVQASGDKFAGLKREKSNGST